MNDLAVCADIVIRALNLDKSCVIELAIFVIVKAAILSDYDNQLYVNTETVKELIVAYRRKGVGRKLWKREEDIIDTIKNDLNIQILPIKEEHIRTYSRLQINEAQGHYDPSDHLIIAHAITEKMPLVSSDHKFDFYIRQGLSYISNF